MGSRHITNGDCTAGTLRTFLSDRVLVTCDVLYDGPAPLVDGNAWHETRARFLADGLEAGPLDGTALFHATQRAEQRPFMGDLGVFQLIHRLAAARVPLVAIEPGAPGLDFGDRTLRLTEAGREVLGGRQDAVALNGIDEWRGGVHLLGHDRSPWRWDARAKTLVS